ncbi:MAG TPA: hypothetical protein VFK05_21140 [Polyangiaceae bacterium]|nr:hypothetical protein [Polyangiaceae bacterium]
MAKDFVSSDSKVRAKSSGSQARQSTLLEADDSAPYYVHYHVAATDTGAIVHVQLVKKPASPPPAPLVTARDNGRTATRLFEQIGEVVGDNILIMLVEAEVLAPSTSLRLPPVVAPPVSSGDDTVLEFAGAEYRSKKAGIGLNSVRWSPVDESGKLCIWLSFGIRRKWQKMGIWEEMRAQCTTYLKNLT